MKRKILLSCMIAVIALILNADDYDQLQLLKKQKSEILLKMHKKRVELIKKTPSLMELHKKIEALYKELAIRIDNNEEMRKLIEQLREVESEIKNITGEEN